MPPLILVAGASLVCHRTITLCPCSLVVEGNRHHRSDIHDSYNAGTQIQLCTKDTAERLAIPLHEDILTLHQEVLKDLDLGEPHAQRLARARIEQAAKELGFELPLDWKLHAELAQGKTPLQAWLSGPSNGVRALEANHSQDEDVNTEEREKGKERDVAATEENGKDLD